MTCETILIIPDRIDLRPKSVVSKEEILELAIEAERTIFENTSGADCTVCTYGGIMEYDKNKGFKKIEYEPNFQLVIINSNIEHSTQSMVSKVKEFENKNLAKPIH